jgi:superfamily I DNA/RNA helicase
MGFDGALPDALHRVAVSFDATEYQLTWNFRSSESLVHLQHSIASRLDPDVTQAVSKAAPETGHIPASLWTFDSAAREAEYIAGWIAQDIAGSGRQPADFALVARQKVADYEQRLTAALAGHGISLRNDDVTYGEIKLQDMLKHEAARLVLGVLRLAAKPAALRRYGSRSPPRSPASMAPLTTMTLSAASATTFPASPATCAHGWQRFPSVRRTRPKPSTAPLAPSASAGSRAM